MGGFGMLGSLLGLSGSLLGNQPIMTSGTGTTVVPENLDGTTNPLGDVVQTPLGIQDLDAVAPGSVNGAIGADGKWYGESLGNTVIDTKNFGDGSVMHGINAMNGEANNIYHRNQGTTPGVAPKTPPATGSKSTGLSGGLGLLSNLAPVGLAAWNDYENRKLTSKQLKNNAKLTNNSIRRDKKLAGSMNPGGSGGTSAKYMDEDY